MSAAAGAVAATAAANAAARARDAAACAPVDGGPPPAWAVVALLVLGALALYVAGAIVWSWVSASRER